MANSYDKGDLVRLSVVFKASDVNTDPTTVTLKVKKPDGTESSYTYSGGQVTKSGTGNYYRDITPDASGTWSYLWLGTGTCQAAEEGEFWVKRSAFS